MSEIQREVEAALIASTFHDNSLAVTLDLAPEEFEARQSPVAGLAPVSLPVKAEPAATSTSLSL